MLLTNKRSEKATVILNDLIKINNDRIGCYQQAMNKATSLDIDLERLFKNIISESIQLKEALIEKVKQLEGNPTDSASLSGMIHRAWVDLKVTFTGNTRNAVINFCEYNEEVAQQAYKVALDMLTSINDKEIYMIVQEQQAALLNSYSSIRKCHEAHNYLNTRLVYFN